MVWWWWIIPATAAVLGVIFLFSGLGSVFRGRVVSGGLGAVGGGGLLAAAAVAALLGLNVQTYSRLTYERPVATIRTKRLGPQYFEATITQPAAGEAAQPVVGVYPMHGDEWRLEAQVLRWKPWANVLGLDTQYRLDRLSGRYQTIEQERSAVRSVHAIEGGAPEVDLPWSISAWDYARKYRRWVDAVDTLYGGGAYMPMADGAEYEVWITQSGLIARPTNAAARTASSGGWTEVN
ncbi:MAG TPA: hypothetical protein VGR32_06335 [Brevundimonas sp.]|jgi:hypothetical protein|uniref:hypothetical protein n=1 Tax=Brevundimonas sp. TaxID=1871086 RepID=UPI002DEA3746|nr:hypothetical protein [Brevundimonas sp.]